MLPVPTTADLADFSGRLPASYGPFAMQALSQATLMFSVASGLEVWPDDPDLMQVGINAVLEMADRLFLEQPYQSVKTSPYQSEAIGSYSYSKGSPASQQRTTDNVGTGLFWWDMALDLLGQRKSLLTASGSIGIQTEGLVQGPDGLLIASPVESDGPDRPPYVRIS